MCVCVRACVRACAHVCVRVWVSVFKVVGGGQSRMNCQFFCNIQKETGLHSHIVRLCQHPAKCGKNVRLKVKILEMETHSFR